MEMVAHGLWTVAAAIAAKRTKPVRLNWRWTAWWGIFPDVVAFGPAFAMGLWLLAASAITGKPMPHGHPPVHLYSPAHSLFVFLAVFGAVSLLARRIVFEMLGWLLHILIDIPTHSFSYYATRFLWPLSDFRVDGIAWWTRWFWVATYAALALVYLILWKKGWLREKPPWSPACSRQP